MDAWEWLIDQSELNDGDAWEHLTHPKECTGDGRLMEPIEIDLNQSVSLGQIDKRVIIGTGAPIEVAEKVETWDITSTSE